MSATEWWKNHYPLGVICIRGALQFLLTLGGSLQFLSTPHGWLSDGSRFLKILRFITWVLYQAADIFSYAGLVFPLVRTDEYSAFTGVFAAFDLLYQGGTDILTSFSLDDNKLWRRRTFAILLKFISCVTVIVQCLVREKHVMYALVVVSITTAALYNCVDRILAHRMGSFDELKTCVQSKEHDRHVGIHTREDQGGSLEKLEEGRRKGIASTLIFLTRNTQQDHSSIEHKIEVPSTHVDPDRKIETLKIAKDSYEKFRGIYVDMWYSFDDRTQTQNTFARLDTAQAFKVADYQMSFMRGEIYSRAVLSHSMAGLIVRVLVLLMTIPAARVVFILFTYEYDFSASDIHVCVTCILFALEFITRALSLYLLLSSPHHIAQHTNSSYSKWLNGGNWQIRRLLNDDLNLFMGQIDLLRLCAKLEEKSWTNGISNFLFSKEDLDYYLLTMPERISFAIQKTIYELLTKKSAQGRNAKEFEKLSKSRGEWALKEMGCVTRLEYWSVQGDFGEDAVSWIIATTLLYHKYKQPSTGLSDNYLNAAKYLCDYFLHLLRVKPDLVSSVAPGVVDISGCTFTHLFQLVREEGTSWDDERVASICNTTLSKNADDLKALLGAQYRSVLHKGIKLGNELSKLESQEDSWRIMCNVWVEILSYLAISSKGQHHAELLGEGRELLTILRLISVQLGFGMQFNFDSTLGPPNSFSHV